MFDGIEELSVNTDNKTGRQSSKFNYQCLVRNFWMGSDNR
jgi:hypothetical protein